MRLGLLIILTCLSVTAGAQQSRSQSGDNGVSSRYEVGEELIFTMQLDRIKLTEVFIIVSPNGFLIELDSFIKTMDFPIEQTNNFVYEGWFIKEENTISLDFSIVADRQYTAILNNQVIAIAQDDVEEHFGAVYITTDVLEKLFPLQFEFDEANLIANIMPSVPLPLQLKLARNNTKIQNTERNAIASFPELYRPYELLSPQSLDVQLNANYSDSTQEITDGYSVIGGREIAFWNSRFFLSGSSEDILGNARLKLSKNFDLNTLDNNWAVKRVEFGDITPVAVGNSAFRGDALGVVLTNRPNLQQLNNDRKFSVIGEVQVGWDAELYRNNSLIDRLSDIKTGEYRFTDLPLYLGENNFRVVLYGPQGQQITREVDRFVDNLSQSDSSSMDYRTSISKLDSSIFSTRNASLFENGQDVYDWSTQINHYLTQNTAVNLGWTLQSADVGLNSLSLGASTAFTDRLRASSDIIINENSVFASIDARAKLKNTDINLTATHEDFKNDMQTSGIALNMRGDFDLGRTTRMSYENSVSHSINSNNQNSTIITNTTGIGSSWGLISHSIDYQRDENKNTNTVVDRLQGALSVRARIGPVSTRGTVSYLENAEQDFDIQNYAIDLAWSPTANLRTRLLTSYTPTSEDWTSRIDVGYQTDTFNFSGFLSHSDAIGSRAGLSARFSLGGEPFSGDVFFTNRTLSSSGSVVVRVFHDKNANYEFDEGETVLENVKVRSIQSVARAKTNNEGIATLLGLSTAKRTDITVDESSVDVPFLKAPLQGVSVLPKTSHIDYIDYPLLTVSEVEGFATIEIDGSEQSLNGIAMLLLNAKGETVKSFSTQFDGYFYIDEIFPGDYRIALTPEAEKRLDLAASVFLDFQIAPGDDFRTLPNLALTRATYDQGYTVNLAKFRNKKFVDVYWATLVTNNIGPVKEYPIFFVENDAKEFELNLGFFTDEADASLVCLQFEIEGTKCEVKVHHEKIRG